MPVSYTHLDVYKRQLHRVLETDGSADSLQAAWQATRKDSSCVALAGCTGNTVAAGVIAQQAQSTADERLAHMAPWLQNADTVLDLSLIHI